MKSDPGFDFDSYWRAWILLRLAVIRQNVADNKSKEEKYFDRSDQQQQQHFNDRPAQSNQTITRNIQIDDCN